MVKHGKNRGGIPEIFPILHKKGVECAQKKGGQKGDKCPKTVQNVTF